MSVGRTPWDILVRNKKREQETSRDAAERKPTLPIGDATAATKMKPHNQQLNVWGIRKISLFQELKQIRCSFTNNYQWVLEGEV